MTNPSTSETPTLRFEIDPDDYGPLFPDKTYQITETDSGRLSIDSVSDTRGENSNDGKTLIISGLLQADNGHNYYWQFSFNDGGQDMESVFRQILSTFKFILPAAGSKFNSLTMNDPVRVLSPRPGLVILSPGEVPLNGHLSAFW